MNRNNKPFLKNLNGLRFIAASYVIAFHFFSFPGNDFLNQLFSKGHIAVPFFFLLSGFVLGYSYSDYNFLGGTKKFIVERIVRIAPIYYMAMFLAIPLAIRNILLTEPAYSAFDLVLNTGLHLIFSQGVIPLKKVLYFWNIHSWSLCVEFFLYLFSPVLILRIRKLKIKSSVIVYLLLLLLNSGIFFYFDSLTKYSIDRGVLISYQPLLYLPTFSTGIVLAKIFITYFDQIRKYARFYFLPTSLILITSFIFPFSESFYSTFNPFYQILFSALLVTASISNSTNKFLGTNLCLLLGDASYAMYMLQAPVKAYTQQFLYKVLGLELNTGWVYALILFGNIILISIIISKYIDPPIRRKILLKLKS
jgi:peptidoglycan/LPS O-acetylase OafA/YrhL